MGFSVVNAWNVACSWQRTCDACNESDTGILSEKEMLQPDKKRYVDVVAKPENTNKRSRYLFYPKSTVKKEKRSFVKKSNILNEIILAKQK